MFRPILQRSAATMAVVLTLAALGTAPANATAYTFSETFDNGSDGAADLPVTVTGSFEGDASGNLITNLSGFTLYFNGVEAATPSTLFLRAYHGGFSYDTNAVLSFDGLANNFLLSNSSDPATTTPSIFLSSLTALGFGNGDMAANGTLTGGNSDPTETILLITEVPEPASLALLGLGIGGILATRRARQA